MNNRNCIRHLCVPLSMGLQERGRREGGGTSTFAGIKEMIHGKTRDVSCLAGVRVALQVWVASATVASFFLQMQMPSSYCLYLLQNHSLPVCFLATVTITSFKNSLPYILQQTGPNLCCGPDALTDKISADCILIFSRELDLQNELRCPNLCLNF
jgi:hypothetical protein